MEMSFSDAMKAIAIATDQILNGKDVVEDHGARKTGFVLLVFPNDDSDRSSYISNGVTPERVARLFKAQFERLDAKNREVEDEQGG